MQQWTPQAKSAAKRARVQHSDDVIDQAVAYAEQLAEEVASPIVDTDLWRQALAVVLRSHAQHRGRAS